MKENELGSALQGRFGLINQMWLHYGVVSTGIAFAAGVDSANAVIVTTAAVTVTLPLAADFPGKSFYIKNDFAGATTIARSGADLIDGATSKSLPNQFDCMHVVSDGVSNWWILSAFPQPL